MFVPVVKIGRVGMRVPHRLVHVLVDVGLGALVAAVGVLVVFVVDVTVGVRNILVPVVV